jgi:hypothetical protein
MVNFLNPSHQHGERAAPETQIAAGVQHQLEEH